MNRRELIAAIAAHSDAEPKTVDAVLRGFTDVVCATVAKGDPVVLSGFAKFAKIQTKARMGRNPATGAAIKIKASKKARITPLKGFKDIVLGAAPAPKLTKAAPAKATAVKKAPVKAAPVKAAARTTARAATTRTTAAKAPAARTTRATKTTTAAKAPASTTRATKATAARKAPARSTTKR
jgi:DNA-binding protein HU-beta